MKIAKCCRTCKHSRCDLGIVPPYVCINRRSESHGPRFEHDVCGMWDGGELMGWKR